MRYRCTPLRHPPYIGLLHSPLLYSTAPLRQLQNVAIEGGGLLDSRGDHWYENQKDGRCTDIADGDCNKRPMMLDLLWVDGLTIRNLKVSKEFDLAPT